MFFVQTPEERRMCAQRGLSKTREEGVSSIGVDRLALWRSNHMSSIHNLI